MVSTNKANIVAATLTLYSLPKNAETITVLIEKELREHPDADAQTLARMLPIQRKTVQADKTVDGLISEFFNLRWDPRRIADAVRLDSTEYEVMYVGEDTLVFDSDDWQSPVVKWILSLLSAIPATARS